MIHIIIVDSLNRDVVAKVGFAASLSLDAHARLETKAASGKTDAWNIFILGFEP